MDKKIEWISVEDRLPALGEQVLICYYPTQPVMRGTLIETGHRIDPKGTALPRDMKKRIESNYGFTNIGIALITHWMAIPERPIQKQSH